MSAKNKATIGTFAIIGFYGIIWLISCIVYGLNSEEIIAVMIIATVLAVIVILLWSFLYEVFKAIEENRKRNG